MDSGRYARIDLFCGVVGRVWLAGVAPLAHCEGSRLKTGLILLGHGSRDPQWFAPMEAVAQRLRLRPTAPQVACAFLEMAAPTLPQCATELIAKGVDYIRIFPLFLGVGKHLREDLPSLLTALQNAHPKVSFAMLPAMGEQQAVLDLLADIAVRD